MLNTMTRVAGEQGVLLHSSTGFIVTEINSLDELVDLGGVLVVGVKDGNLIEDSWAWCAGADLLDKLHANPTPAALAWAVITQYYDLACVGYQVPGDVTRISMIGSLGFARSRPGFMFPGYTTSHRIFGIKTSVYSGSGSSTPLENLSVGRYAKIKVDSGTFNMSAASATTKMPSGCVGAVTLRIPQGRTWQQAIDVACDAMYNETESGFKSLLAPAMPHIKRRMVSYIGDREDLSKDMSVYASFLVTKTGLRMLPSSPMGQVASVYGSANGYSMFGTIVRSAINGARTTLPALVGGSSEVEMGLVGTSFAVATEAQINASILTRPLFGGLDDIPAWALSGGLVGADFDAVTGLPIERPTYTQYTSAAIWETYRDTIIVGGVAPSASRPMVDGLPVSNEVWAADLQGNLASKVTAGLNQITTGSWDINNRSLGFFTATMAAACHPSAAQNWEMWGHDTSMASFATVALADATLRVVPSARVFPGDDEGDVSKLAES